jgi:hypothetical protein
MVTFSIVFLFLNVRCPQCSEATRFSDPHNSDIWSYSSDPIGRSHPDPPCDRGRYLELLYSLRTVRTFRPVLFSYWKATLNSSFLVVLSVRSVLYQLLVGEVDPNGWSTVLITAPGSWEKTAPRSYWNAAHNENIRRAP